MDQLVMTGLFPVGSEERKRERGRKMGNEKPRKVWFMIQGHPRVISSLFIRLPDRNHDHPPEMIAMLLCTVYL